MPIYEYRCNACGHELETLQKLSDAPLTDCPACHTHGLVKQVSAAGFQLKGSGWYATDFKGSGAKSSDTKSATEAKSNTKTDATTDAKTDGKSESKSDAAAASGGCGAGCACH